MQRKTKVTAGGIVAQHHATLVRAQKAKQGLTVKTNITAGFLDPTWCPSLPCTNTP